MKRDPVMTIAQICERLGVDAVWQEDTVKAPETAVEPRTDAAWVWVGTGIRWRSCGCAHAGLTHRRDKT